MAKRTKPAAPPARRVKRLALGHHLGAGVAAKQGAVVRAVTPPDDAMTDRGVRTPLRGVARREARHA